MSKAKNKLPASYSEATAELEKIVEDLQSDHVDVDQLTEQVKRAKVLISFCQEKLRNTEKEVTDLFSDDQD